MPTVLERLRLPLFAGLSLVLHGAIFGAAALRREPKVEPPAFESKPGALVGETLEVEPVAVPQIEESEPSPAATASPGRSEPAPPRAATPQSPGMGAHPPSAPGAAAGAPAATPSLFGAVGVRYATDLATTFTRGFPQAGSADPVWSTVPFGPAGTADVTMVLDEAGHLVSSTVGGSPSPALRRGIERTLVLLGTRTFTARGATTRLRVTARVTKDDVHDGLHGDVFALSGGSFTRDVGTAFFALPGAGGQGRRIDLELRLLP